MISYPDYKKKYPPGQKKPDKSYWTMTEIAQAEGMTIDQIQAYANYWYAGEQGAPPDFTPKPVPVPDPVVPVPEPDHTGMMKVETPFGDKWVPKLWGDLSVPEGLALIRAQFKAEVLK